ncbi:MAG TPA: hypothetical protein DEH78_08075 [Solibacterales bacterium]|nr:hypothetical protein [Bryobacterales bacterium]
MSGFSGSPKVQRGAIVGLDPLNPVASIVIFQYNPHTLTRTIAPNAAGNAADAGEALRLKGPPSETINVEIEIDATDQLEKGSGTAVSMGLYPALSALEMLLYPKTALVIANEVLARAGIIEVIPPEAPLTLFVWGIKRVLPVRLTQLTITEEEFDTALNPIRAKVTLAMKVLSYQDLGLVSPGGALFMAHQVVKEVMATINGVGNIAGSASFSASAGG